jgi:GPH family glycoside/pentoside/hexuronide:cation symporter
MSGGSRLSLPRLGLFAGPTLAVGALGIPLGVYLPAYYAGHLGVDLGAVGIAFAAVQLIAILFDPAVGFGLDATQTRFGRFRPWMLGSGPVLAIATVAVFMATPGVSVSYLILWQLLLYFGLSMNGMSTNAWGAVLAPEYHERSRLYAWVQVLGYCGALTCLLLPKILSVFGDADEISVVHTMGWLVIVLAPLSALLAVTLVREPPSPQAHRERIGLREYLSLIRRPAMLRLLSACLLLTSAPALTGALYFFFFHQALGFSFDQSTTLLLIYIAAGLLMSLWARIARLLGKHRALMVAAFLSAITQCALLILPRGLFWPMAVTMLIAGFAANCYNLLLNAMVADVSDEIRLETQQDRTAPLFALMTAAAKIGAAVPLAVTFPILKAVGFNAAVGAMNTAAAIRGLENCFVFAPVLAMALGGLCLWGYHLNARRHGEIRKRLEEHDALTLAAGLSMETMLSPATRATAPVELDGAP